MGGQEDTLWSPAGIGDLILTCTSPQSRNFRFGQMIGQGVPVDAALAELGTVEGARSIGAILPRLEPDKAPIIAGLWAVLQDCAAPADVLARLMARPVPQG